MIETFYLTATESHTMPTDLAALCRALNLSPEALEELLALDFLQPMCRLTFPNTDYQATERARESKRRYYESVKHKPAFRESERKRVAASKAKPKKLTAYQKRLMATPF